MILGKVLQLDMPAGEPTSSAGTEELKRSPCPTILTNTFLHCLIFLDGCFCELRSKNQYLMHSSACGRKKVHDSFLFERINLYSLTTEPMCQLQNRIGVLDAGKTDDFRFQILPAFLIDLYGLCDKGFIDQDTSVVYDLVLYVFLPERFRNRKTVQFLFDGDLCFDIALVVCLEQFPALRAVFRTIPGTEAVRFRRGAGNTEVFDQLFPFLQLLLVEV